MVTEDSLCPFCSEKGKVNRVTAVFFSCEDALYTCEDKKCTYFLANTEGNLIKFNKKINGTSVILDTVFKNDTPKICSKLVSCNRIEDELNNMIKSLQDGHTELDTISNTKNNTSKSTEYEQFSEDPSVKSSMNENQNCNLFDTNLELDFDYDFFYS